MSTITRKFWIDSHGNKWIVFCAGETLVWVSQYDEAFEVRAA